MGAAAQEVPHRPQSYRSNQQTFLVCPQRPTDVLRQSSSHLPDRTEADVARLLLKIQTLPTLGAIHEWLLYPAREDRKSTRLNSSHVKISYAVFCLNKKKTIISA